jgi:hypothetical protein
MKNVMIRCELCKAALDVEKCELATYRTIIDGKEHTFCCVKCADRYQKSQKK